jgi:hypothetical protein
VKNSKSSIDIEDGFDEKQDCFVITTPTATYYYQKEAGGFSSMLDREGTDWINFKPEKTTTRIARGIPNLVWPDNVAHPGYFNAESRFESPNTIYSRTKDGLWEWRWIFADETATLDILKTAPKRKYWFLYEGTIGGVFDPDNSFWGTEIHGRRYDAPVWPDGNTKPFHDKWQVAYFGHNDFPRVLFAFNHSKELSLNLFSYMSVTEKGLWASDGMTVYGFGRDHGPKPLLEGPNTFTIGFLESNKHPEIMKILENYIFNSTVANP